LNCRVTLKLGLGSLSHRKCHHSIDWVWFPMSLL